MVVWSMLWDASEMKKQLCGVDSWETVRKEFPAFFPHVSEFMIISRYDWTIKRHIATLDILWIQGNIGPLFPEAEDEMDP